MRNRNYSHCMESEWRDVNSNDAIFIKKKKKKIHWSIVFFPRCGKKITIVGVLFNVWLIIFQVILAVESHLEDAIKITGLCQPVRSHKTIWFMLAPRDSYINYPIKSKAVPSPHHFPNQTEWVLVSPPSNQGQSSVSAVLVVAATNQRAGNSISGWEAIMCHVLSRSIPTWTIKPIFH